MKQVFKKGTKIQVVSSCDDYWYKVGEVYTVHSYLPDEDGYVVGEDSNYAWIDAKDVEQFIDWDNAPEGATHYNNVDCIEPWLKLDNGVHYYYRRYDNTWIEYVAGWDYHFANAIKRPAEEKKEMNEWKHGLPPVGIEFEYSFGGNYWFKATCNYVVGDSGVVALCETMEAVVEQYLDDEECEFRPIKSKEQQEKDDAINEIAFLMGRGTFVEDAESIWNAGYRKVE